MNKPAKKTFDVDEVPEVRDFEEAERRLDSWKRSYPGAYEELREILEYRNTALENAEKVVRAREITVGSFKLDTYRTTVDASSFYDAVGRDDFLAMGGSIETIPTYGIDKKKFEAAVAQGKVSGEIVQKVVTHAPSFKMPKKTEIP